MLQEVQRIDQKYYPEMLHVTYIVNAGWVFRAVWKVLKVVFPARDHSKMKLIPGGKKGLEMLKEVIPEEHIPRLVASQMDRSADVGCKCVRGCVSGPLGSGDQPSDNQEKMMKDLREIRALIKEKKEGLGIHKTIREWATAPQTKELAPSRPAAPARKTWR